MTSVSPALHDVERLILSSLDGSNLSRPQAEAALLGLRDDNPDAYCQALLMLFSCTNCSPSKSVRAFSSVMLRQAFSSSGQGNFFLRLSPATQAIAKEILLKLFQTENDKSLRRKLNQVIAILCAAIVPVNGWPEFLPSFFAFSQTAGLTPAQREGVADLIEKLADFLDFQLLKAHFVPLKRFLSNCLSSAPDENVRLAALKAVIALLIAADEPSQKRLEELIPLIFGGLQQLAANQSQGGDDEFIADFIEVLVNLTRTKAKFLKPHVPEIITLMVQITAAKQFEEATRKISLEFLLSLADGGGGMIRKQKQFALAVIPTVFNILLDTVRNSEEIECEEENELFVFALEAIGRLAVALGGAIFLPIALPAIQQAMLSPDWQKRLIGILVMRDMIEGVQEAVEPQLDQIVQAVLPYISKDPSQRVRFSAILCIGQFAEILCDFQEKFHATVIPTLIEALNPAQNQPLVCAQAATAILQFGADQEEDHISPYMEPLLRACIELLNSNHLKVQEAVLSCLSAIALVVGDKFQPYFSSFFGGVKQILLGATTLEQREMRGRAIEAIGAMAEAVGAEMFGPLAAEIMEILVSAQQRGLSADDPQYAHMVQCQARICKCMKQRFLPYLPVIIPPLIKSAQLENAVLMFDADDAKGAEERPGYESMTVDLRGLGQKRIQINSALMDEKTLAVNMLYQYATELREGFFPHANETLGVLIPALSYALNENIRIAAVAAMPALLKCVFYAMENNPTERDSALRVLVDRTLQPILDAAVKEVQLENLSGIIDSLADYLDVLPFAISGPQLDSINKLVKQITEESLERILEREKRRKDEDFDEEEERNIEGENNVEEEFLGYVYVLIAKLSMKNGGAFLDKFHKALQPTFQAMLDSAVLSLKVTAICVFSQLVNDQTGPHPVALGYAQALLPICLKFSENSSLDARQAAVFGLGSCAKRMEGKFLPALEKSVAALLSVIQHKDSRNEENEPATDNAIGAIGKICKFVAPAVEEAKRGAFQGLLAQWVHWLPCKGDEEESANIHALLADWVEQGNSAILGQNNANLPKIVQIFASSFDTLCLHAETQRKALSMIKAMKSGMGESNWSILCQTLQASELEKLQALMA